MNKSAENKSSGAVSTPPSGNTESASSAMRGLTLLRTPFPPEQISKLPKPTKAQTEAVRNDYKAGVRCEVCGTWHHPKVVHLDYIGHAALTNRLLDADPLWSWEPVATDDHGLPFIDKDGGMWIKLTVCGMTRLGYGDAEGKTGPAAMKERIGDALRNAAMRFGAALDLWNKGEAPLYHGDEPEQAKPELEPEPPARLRTPWTDAQLIAASKAAEKGEAAYKAWWGTLTKETQAVLQPTKQHADYKAAALRVDSLAADALTAKQEADLDKVAA